MHDFGTSREPQKCDEEISLCFIRAETESHADGPSEAADGKHIIATPLRRNRGLCPSGLHTRAQDQFGSNVCELTPSNCPRHSWYGCRNRGHKSGKRERKGGDRKPVSWRKERDLLFLFHQLPGSSDAVWWRQRLGDWSESWRYTKGGDYSAWPSMLTSWKASTVLAWRLEKTGPSRLCESVSTRPIEKR